MRRLKFVSRLAYLATVLVWLFVCANTYIRLVGDAADSPEIYTRSSGFQLVNFVWQYLPGYFLFLVIALLVEVAAFSALLFLARRFAAAHVAGDDR